MEAELVDELPSGDWQYEPKWDGFRGVLENLGGGLRLWSRNGRPLLRYFPELAEVGALLPPESALDGEIVIQQKGRLDFDALQMRLHPAESRIRKLSAEIPSEFVAFDLLVWKGEPVWKEPLKKRRNELERKAKRFLLSPASTERKQGEKWLAKLAQAGLDGVVAKRLDAPYLPGSRDGVAKVKPYKTADCVIVGFRWSDKGDGRISTLLLGLYGDEGELDFVGHCSGFPAPVRRELEEKLPKMVSKGKLSDKRIPGGQSRWSAGRELDWNPVRPKLVIEVRYDKLEKNRFRHGTRFLSFRPAPAPRERPDRSEAARRSVGQRRERLRLISTRERSPGGMPSCSKRGSRLAFRRHMPAVGSPTLAIRLRIVFTVNRDGSQRETSFQSIGAETRAS
jgi:ATP-dependent DNA ligase